MARPSARHHGHDVQPQIQTLKTAPALGQGLAGVQQTLALIGAQGFERRIE